MFTIEIRHDADTLLADAETWDSLARGVPFRETAWLKPWWDFAGRSATAVVVTARDRSGRLRGLLPLYRRDDESVLRIFGDGDACSDHVSVLAEAADVESVAEQIGRFLARTAGDVAHHWQTIDIDGIVEGDTAAAALVHGLNSGGCITHASSRMNVWRKAADACWDDHLKHHGKTQRRRMRRWREKFDTIEGAERCVAKTHAEVDELLGRVIDLHQRRWTEAGQRGSFADPAFCEFIFATAKQFLDAGRLYLATMKLNGEVVAGDLNLIGEDRFMYSFTAGYDVDHADIEPGRIMCIDGLVELYRSDLKGIDFMRGDESYKRRFAKECRKLIRLRAVAPTWASRAKHAAWATGFGVKQIVRRGVGRPLVNVVDFQPLPAGHSPSFGS